MCAYTAPQAFALQHIDTRTHAHARNGPSYTSTAVLLCVCVCVPVCVHVSVCVPVCACVHTWAVVVPAVFFLKFLRRSRRRASIHPSCSSRSPVSLCAPRAYPRARVSARTQPGRPLCQNQYRGNHRVCASLCACIHVSCGSLCMCMCLCVFSGPGGTQGVVGHRPAPCTHATCARALSGSSRKRAQWVARPLGSVPPSPGVRTRRAST
jgi:hypothetical protein